MFSIFSIVLLQLFTLIGSVSSNHFSSFEYLDVSVSNWQKKGSFDGQTYAVEISSNSTFKITFSEPGIYRIAFGAPFHEYVFTDYYIDKGGSSKINIKLDAIALVGRSTLMDTSFSQWIDVIGNFNNWDQETAQKLVYDKKLGGITTTIDSPLDTIWYRVSGLGIPVLPNSDFYESKYVNGRWAQVAGILNPDGKVKLSFVPGIYPFPLASQKKYGIEILQQQKTEEYFNRYFKFSSSKEELVAKKLTHIRYFDSGFYFGFFETQISNRFRSFDHVLDSLFEISSKLPSFEYQEPIERLQQFEFVLAGIHRMAAETLLGEDVPGDNFSTKNKQWNHFIDVSFSFGGSHPLWSSMMFHRIGFVKMILVEPRFWDLMDAITMQTTDYIFSMEFLNEVGNMALERGNMDLSQKCLRVMEQRFPNAQISLDFRQLINDN